MKNLITIVACVLLLGACDPVSVSDKVCDRAIDAQRIVREEFPDGAFCTGNVDIYRIKSPFSTVGHEHFDFNGTLSSQDLTAKFKEIRDYAEHTPVRRSLGTVILTRYEGGSVSINFNISQP